MSKLAKAPVKFNRSLSNETRQFYKYWMYSGGGNRDYITLHPDRVEHQVNQREWKVQKQSYCVLGIDLYDND